MSNDRAIAAVTATLRNMLFQAVSNDAELAGATVTTRPPDRARQGGATSNQINLFLYQTSVDAAWRNQDPPGIRPGEFGQPPLPLVLSYLMTAYGEDDDEVLAHRLLGVGMQLLNDQPLLSPARHRRRPERQRPGRPARPDQDYPAPHPHGRDLQALGHVQHRVPHLGELRRRRSPDRQYPAGPGSAPCAGPLGRRRGTACRRAGGAVRPTGLSSPRPARRPPRRHGDLDRSAPGRRLAGPGCGGRAERPAAAAGRHGVRRCRHRPDASGLAAARRKRRRQRPGHRR